MKKQNILYISYDGLTDPLGQSQILPYLFGLSKEGYRFTVISAEKSDAYLEEAKHIRQLCEANNVDWKPIAYTKKPPIISTLKDVRAITKLALSLHKEKQFLASHCRSYISAIVGLKLKQKQGIKFIFDMRGFWADERVDGHIWDLKQPHYRLVYNYFKKKEKEFLNQADAIVSLTHAAKDIMQTKWMIKKPIYVVPCAVDTELFMPINDVKSFDAFQSASLTLGYLGSIGTWYMLDEMLDFFKVLLEYIPKARFKFITKEKPEAIEEKAKSKRIDISSLEIVSAIREEVPKQLSEIDLGLFFIKPAFSKQASSPVKQGEFMAMGIPVVTNKGVGDTDTIITDYNSGILIDGFGVEAYHKAVKSILETINADKSKIVKGAHQYFSLTKGNKTYTELYQTIL